MLKRLANAVASNPRTYEIIQCLLGQHVVRDAIASALPEHNIVTLDVGSATGGVVRQLVPGAIAADLDLTPLANLKMRDRAAPAVQCNASHLPLRDHAVRMTTCVAVSHHLDDPTLTAALTEIARVTSDVFVFADAVRDDSRFIGRLLWHYDRGASPRTAHELEAAVQRNFVITKIVRVKYLHQYWIAVARPRAEVSS